MPAFTHNLKNCTTDAQSDYTPQELATLEISVFADSGYEFDPLQPPVILWYDMFRDEYREPLTISQDLKTATISGDYSQRGGYGIGVTAVAVLGAPVVTASLTENLTNCTTGAQSEYTENELTALSITFVADNGYEFDTAPSIYYSDGGGGYEFLYATISNDKKAATLTANVITSPWYSFNAGLTANATAVVATPEPTANVTKNMTFATTDAKDTYTETELQNVEINFYAGDDYIFEFDNAPFIMISDGTGGYININTTLSQDLKTATFEGDLYALGYVFDHPIILVAVAVPMVTPSIDYGSFNVYKITNDALTAFARIRFNTEETDLGDFVQSIRRVYVPIDATVTDVLQFGDNVTNISALVPAQRFTTVDFGKVTIPTPNNDNVDYNSEIKVFLPFVGFIDVPSELVGYDFGVSYKVDILAGEAVIYLTVDGDPFNIIECSPYQNYVFATAYQRETQSINNNGFNNTANYGFTPFILMKSYDTKNANVVNASSVRTVIGQTSGKSRFTECTKIVNSDITFIELDMINDLLAQGVTVV